MPLSRRALLLAAAGLCARVASGAPMPSSCLVWRDGLAALWRPDAAPLTLPASLAVDPVATAAGLWVATREARLQRWRLLDGWRREADRALPGAAHALAAAPDGRSVLVACGEALMLFDAQAEPLRRYEGVDMQRRRHGQATALHALPHRRSLLAAWPSLHEWWEISLDPAAPPIFDGLVHDHRLGEGLARPGFLGVRRVSFDAAVPAPAFVPPAMPWVAAPEGPDAVRIVHLDVRRTVAQWPAPGARLAASTLHDGLWWLPVEDTLWGIDPRRWIPRDPVAAPGHVTALASAGGALWSLVGSDMFRHEAGGWTQVAQGVGALASGPGPVPLWAPLPWRGVAAAPG